MNYSNFSILDTIGNTPIIQVDNVYAKLEFLNPSGSIKDRPALEIINSAEKEGKLKKNYTIVEASSGNMAISLAMISLVKGYKMIAVMPENMSEERKKILKVFNTKIELTSKEGSLREAKAKAEELSNKPKTFYSNQFSNANNIIAQEKTGKEIVNDIGSVDAVVAGVGTGGTLIGISNIIKKFNPDVKVIAVEPDEVAVMSGKKIHPNSEHKIQGIGDGFIPPLINMENIDEVITVKSERAIEQTKKLVKKYGLFVGVSSGANIFAANKIAQDYDKVVTVLPDRGERYLSMGIFY